MPTALAHALPQSIGAVPLTVVLTAMLGAYLAVGALSTRRAATRIGAGREMSMGGTRMREGPVGTSVVGLGRSPREDADTWTPPVRDDQDRVRPTPVQVLGVLALLLVAALATLGPADAGSNLTDRAVLVLLWGAVGISSIILGPWWYRVDPVRGLTGALSTAVGDPDQDLAHPLPRGLATAAAVVGLLGWAWLQLFVHVSVAAFQLALLIYVVVHLAGAARFGVAWLQQTESLNVLSGTLALLRPADGGPLRRLTTMADDDRLRWICGSLVGWSLVDLITETEGWHDLGPAPWVGPLLLATAMCGTYGLIRAVSSTARLGPAFVAVAGAWVVAHYLSILLVEGQGVPIWLSDPFATGADLFGRRGTRIDPEPLPLGVMAAMQSLPFIAGHLIALVVVQRRAAQVVSRPGQLGPTTFFARTLIGVLLLVGTYLQLGGV